MVLFFVYNLLYMHSQFWTNNTVIGKNLITKNKVNVYSIWYTNWIFYGINYRVYLFNFYYIYFCIFCYLGHPYQKIISLGGFIYFLFICVIIPHTQFITECWIYFSVSSATTDFQEIFEAFLLYFKLNMQHFPFFHKSFHESMQSVYTKYTHMLCHQQVKIFGFLYISLGMGFLKDNGFFPCVWFERFLDR